MLPGNFLKEKVWWTRVDSNHRRRVYKTPALSTELRVHLGLPDRIRTCTLRIRSPSLCPIKLRGGALEAWYRRRDSNSHAFRLRILSPLRLPVPPRRHRFSCNKWGVSCWKPSAPLAQALACIPMPAGIFLAKCFLRSALVFSLQLIAAHRGLTWMTWPCFSSLPFLKELDSYIIALIYEICQVLTAFYFSDNEFLSSKIFFNVVITTSGFAVPLVLAITCPTKNCKAVCLPFL
jgi:hypothetical protein